MDLSPENMRWAVQAMAVLLLSICVHEFGHAIVAHKLGDDTPSRQGRVTLNPLAHADPIGTLLFPLIGLLYAGAPGFGWGKPVQVQPRNFSRKFSMRTGHMFVAAAGPTMNLVFATIIAVIHVTLLKFEVLQAIPSEWLDPAIMHRGLQFIRPDGTVEAVQAAHILLFYAVSLNFILMFFNLIPAPPLDGGAVAEGLMPSRWLQAWRQFSVYGPFILMAVILIPQLSRIFLWPAFKVTAILYEGLSALFGLT